jgi:hypothetical protein
LTNYLVKSLPRNIEKGIDLITQTAIINSK